MKVRLQLFGKFRSFSNDNEIDLTISEGTKIKDLRAILAKSLKGIPKDSLEKLIKCSRFADAEKMLEEEDVVGENVSLAILPPVSGG